MTETFVRNRAGPQNGPYIRVRNVSLRHADFARVRREDEADIPILHQFANFSAFGFEQRFSAPTMRNYMGKFDPRSNTKLS